MHDIDYTEQKVGMANKHEIPDKTMRVSQTLDVSYFGTVESQILKRLEKDISESNAGNLANQDIRLMDLFHEADGETAEYLRLLNQEAGEEYEQCIERTENALFHIARFLTETIENGELTGLAQEIIDTKMVSEVARGGTIEAMGIEHMADHWDATEVGKTSTEVAAMTGCKDPEARGLDAALKVDGEVRTIQVKEGEGGDLPDSCEADYVVRINTETGSVKFKPNE